MIFDAAPKSRMHDDRKSLKWAVRTCACPSTKAPNPKRIDTGMLSGIEDIVCRSGLADRAIFLALRPIADERRRTERPLFGSAVAARFATAPCAMQVKLILGSARCRTSG